MSKKKVKRNWKKHLDHCNFWINSRLAEGENPQYFLNQIKYSIQQLKKTKTIVR